MSKTEKRSKMKTNLPHLIIEYLGLNKQSLENGRTIKSESNPRTQKIAIKHQRKNQESKSEEE